MDDDADPGDEVGKWERDYAHFDVPSDTLASVELVAFSLARIGTGDSWWKWMVVGAHMAAATAMVGYLTGTSGVGALNDRSTKALLEWYELPNPRPNPPEERLAEFGVLLARIANGEQGSSLGNLPVDVASTRDDLRRLNWIRSRFNHFRETSWGIEKRYLIPFLCSALSLVSDIDENGWAFRHAKLNDRKRLGSLLVQLQVDLRDLRSQLDSRAS